MNERQIREKISEGYVHVRAILEIVGKPKKYVEDALQDHLKKIKTDKNFEITTETVEPAEEQEGFFSTFAEIEVLVKNTNSVLSLCFDYMPSSVEILEPQEIVLNNSVFSGLLNDMQTRLHVLNTGMLQMKDQNKFYIKNTAVLLRNFLVVLLSSRPMTVDQLQPFLGVKKDDILKILNVLITEKKIKKEGDTFKTIPKK